MNNAVAHQFDDAAQQHESSMLGMWVFLATEIMFFGGLFLAYTIYRTVHPQMFEAGSRHLNVVLGSINTAVLLTSSLTMALAVHNRRRTIPLLVVTMLLGVVFLAIKGVEYHEHWGPFPRGEEMFFYLYFAMTGLHALHMIAGVTVVGTVAWMASRGYYNPVEIAGLYWHFVDIVWIFLFPLLYLIGHHP